MNTCEKVCKECPFKKNSPPGWLGGVSVDDTIATLQNEGIFTCHLHRNDKISVGSVMVGRYPICRGFMLSAKKSAKMFGGLPGMISAGLSKLQREMIYGEEELSEVMDVREFYNHHTPKKNG